MQIAKTFALRRKNEHSSAIINAMDKYGLQCEVLQQTVRVLEEELQEALFGEERKWIQEPVQDSGGGVGNVKGQANFREVKGKKRKQQLLRSLGFDLQQISIGIGRGYSEREESLRRESGICSTREQYYERAMSKSAVC